LGNLTSTYLLLEVDHHFWKLQSATSCRARHH
jgi:hypothetical protein